jgi:hypothetical protein
VNLRAGLDNVEKRKLLTLAGLEILWLKYKYKIWDFVRRKEVNQFLNKKKIAQNICYTYSNHLLHAQFEDTVHVERFRANPIVPYTHNNLLLENSHYQSLWLFLVLQLVHRFDVVFRSIISSLVIKDIGFEVVY